MKLFPHFPDFNEVHQRLYLLLDCLQSHQTIEFFQQSGDSFLPLFFFCFFSILQTLLYFLKFLAGSLLFLLQPFFLLLFFFCSVRSSFPVLLSAQPTDPGAGCFRIEFMEKITLLHRRIQYSVTDKHNGSLKIIPDICLSLCCLPVRKPHQTKHLIDHCIHKYRRILRLTMTVINTADLYQDRRHRRIPPGILDRFCIKQFCPMSPLKGKRICLCQLLQIFPLDFRHFPQMHCQFHQH